MRRGGERRACKQNQTFNKEQRVSDQLQGLVDVIVQREASPELDICHPVTDGPRRRARDVLQQELDLFGGSGREIQIEEQDRKSVV